MIFCLTNFNNNNSQENAIFVLKGKNNRGTSKKKDVKKK